MKYPIMILQRCISAIAVGVHQLEKREREGTISDEEILQLLEYRHIQSIYEMALNDD